MEKIDSFRGEYYFLSNFYNAPVTYDGLIYQNNEAAFQSAKTLDYSKRLKYINVDPSTAKKMGRRENLREDWESIKEEVMYQVVLNKFTCNPKLATSLLETGDTELIEANNWGDKCWGVVNGEGLNKLGKILMRVRSELTI